MPPSNIEIYVRLDRVEGPVKQQVRVKVQAQQIRIPGSDLPWALHEIVGDTDSDRYAITYIPTGHQLTSAPTKGGAIERAGLILAHWGGDKAVVERLENLKEIPLENIKEVQLAEVNHV